MELRPLRLAPYYKEYIWGGTKLKSEYGKVDAPTITAESWELASHRDGSCTIIDDGVLRGKTLHDLAIIDKNAFWGKRARGKEFPILVKLIDAAKPLSVQVHPSDELAIRENGESGKAEMWYIVESEPHSFLYYGLSRCVCKDELIRRANDGTITDVLNAVPVRKGDVFFILPGTIHAIGAGMVIAEIQQNSNTTFRLYDYMRKDQQGNLRPLHLERASAVANILPVIPAECRANRCLYMRDFAESEMFSCRYFKAYKLDIHGRACFHTDGESFLHLLCVEGTVCICCREKEYLTEKGDSLFIPAMLGKFTVSGSGTLLVSML